VKRAYLLLVLLLVAALGSSCSSASSVQTTAPASTDLSVVALPTPSLKGGMPLDEALAKRRSVRSYTSGPLRLPELSQLLWAAQGITDDRGGRTAPSAGATYPLELLVVVGSVDGVSPGVYRYDPATHSLKRTAEGDLRDKLASAALGQASVGSAAVDIVIAAAYERTTARYGERGERFVHLEAGHAAQNVCLEATALGLGVVTVGAFDDAQVAEAAGLADGESPLYILPIGRKS